MEKGHNPFFKNDFAVNYDGRVRQQGWYGAKIMLGMLFEHLKPGEKNLATDLKQFDLTQSPLPYPSRFFDHISANAVLYFIRQLDPLFEEIARIIKPWGIWAFIVKEDDTGPGAQTIIKPENKSGIVTYEHSRDYLLDLIKANGFTPLKRLACVAENFQMQGRPVPFTLYVTRAGHFET